MEGARIFFNGVLLNNQAGKIATNINRKETWFPRANPEIKERLIGILRSLFFLKNRKPKR